MSGRRKADLVARLEADDVQKLAAKAEAAGDDEHDEHDEDLEDEDDDDDEDDEEECFDDDDDELDAVSKQQNTALLE